MTVAAPPSDKASQIAARSHADYPVPDGREEEWRFTPLAPLQPLLVAAPATGAGVSVHCEGSGVSVHTTERAEATAVLGSPVADRLAAVVNSQAETVTTVSVAKEARADATVTITGEGGVAYQHLVIDVADDAVANVVLRHRGSVTLGQNVEVRTGQGAKLTLVSVQEWDDDAVHGGQTSALVGRDSRFHHIVVTLGGALVRLVPTVQYAGPGGDAELDGLYFVDAAQHLEHRVFVDHNTAHCRSRVTYKGALQGEGAHSVWVGDVLIRATAVGTDTYELNRNLILTDGARADSVPNLEIETGEVAGAGHASATGRFDDEQLFYLQSRGIDPDTARRLVVMGFFGEILDRIPHDDVRHQLRVAVAAELGYDWDETDNADD